MRAPDDDVEVFEEKMEAVRVETGLVTVGPPFICHCFVTAPYVNGAELAELSPGQTPVHFNIFWTEIKMW